ncbi:MAG: phytanoyl-CoA dioxygenase family protein [Phycisphaerae bacterium]|nr:phytanoyl-CoA dioxygenase family protein [Phycisphaerae bacterium]
MEPTIVLTQEQVDFYHRQGYLNIPAITTPEEVARLRAIYDDLFRRRVGREEGNQFDLGGTDEENKEPVLPQILGPSRYAPALNDTLLRVNALAIAIQLLGPTTKFGGDHAILKPAKIGAATPWHQDEAYWAEDVDHEAISIWIPLQPATMINGCMQFIPRSQLLGVQPHHTIGHDPRVHGLEMDLLPDLGQAVACPLPAGGATIHHARTMHYTGPNKSDEPRRAYILTYSTESRQRATPRNHYWNRTKTTPREQRARQAQQAAAKAAGGAAPPTT